MVSTVPQNDPASSAPGFWAKPEWGDIVVALDGTQESRGALIWAAGLASITGSRIRLVHALISRHSPALGNQDSTRSRVQVQGRRLLRSARSELFGIDPGIVVDSILTDDPIASALGALSHTADLVVIGGRASGPIREIVFGRNATRIVTASTCPVLVWRAQPRDAAPNSPVVVGVDRSESCTRAIDAAFWYADALDVPLTALHVRSPHERPAPEESAPEQMRTLHWLGGRVAAAASAHPAVVVHLHVLEASAEHELRLASASAHLLVVGSRGHGPWAAPILGSIGRSLVHASGGPILVMR
ncbi:universal stress protein [Rhodococcus sp. ARC_M5]|nr:universal stress protein [Rhodococcus sp. ARC_M5]